MSDRKRGGSRKPTEKKAEPKVKTPEIVQVDLSADTPERPKSRALQASVLAYGALATKDSRTSKEDAALEQVQRTFGAEEAFVAYRGAELATKHGNTVPQVVRGSWQHASQRDDSTNKNSVQLLCPESGKTHQRYTSDLHQSALHPDAQKAKQKESRKGRKRSKPSLKSEFEALGIDPEALGLIETTEASE